MGARICSVDAGGVRTRHIRVHAHGSGWGGRACVYVDPALVVYAWWTRRIRRRRAILRKPFPREWEAVLQRDVVFFRVLDGSDQQRFRRQLQVFLGEKRITGIKVQLDTTTRVLAATSAIIPIFGFPDWEWDQINEVLIYPTRFDGKFEFGDTRAHNTLGMVGTGSLNRLMILSKPDLINGFRNPTDKRNVGVHEFAHLVDKTDGVIDGVPEVGLNRQAIGPWIDLVRRKMAEIEAGTSDINRYALTNEAEFFAVIAEYFFRAARCYATQTPGPLRGSRTCVQPESSRSCGCISERAVQGSAEVRSEFALSVWERTQVQEVLSGVTL